MAKYTVSTDSGSRVVTAYVDGEMLTTSEATNPNYAEICQRLFEDNLTDIKVLFSAQAAVEEKFKKVSPRVSVKGGKVYFDSDPIDNFLSEHLLELIYNGDDVTPLVMFWENIAQNPSNDSKEHLLQWLQAEKFTITPQGFIVGYKGLREDHTSIHYGPGIVDGVPMEGHLPNKEGSIVEIARSEVTTDRQRDCAFGLHVGTEAYARSFGHGVTVEVLVNPRDVVSVPTGHSSQKMRVCRYLVGKVSEAKRTENVATDVVADNDFAYGKSGEWKMLAL